MRICRVATVPFFLLHHLGEQIQETVRAGHGVTVVSSDGPEIRDLADLADIECHVIPIARQISLIHDLVALVRLYRFFRRKRFDLVHSTTPKAGLLTAIAAMLAGVPVRIHTFTGQPWVERRGLVRWLARVGDRLIVLLCTKCYTDSASQRDFLVAEGIARNGKVSVVGSGSIGGVDLKRFNRSRRSGSGAIRAALSIPADAVVIGFVGRVTRDKGVEELTDAFAWVRQRVDASVFLIIVGPLELGGNEIRPDVMSALQSDEDVRMVGYAPHPEEFMAAFDILCLPSYREGFGGVVIEAAAMGIPAVGTRIVGLTDAVVDGTTGILVPPKNSTAIGEALLGLIRDRALRGAMGAAAEARAIQEFDSKVVNSALLADYQLLSPEAAWPPSHATGR